MKLQAYAIFDNKGKVFSHPFYTVNDDTAIRMFDAVVRDKESNVGKYPADFSLYAVGQFDDSLGLFTDEDNAPNGPRLLIHAVTLSEAQNAS